MNLIISLLPDSCRQQHIPETILLKQIISRQVLLTCNLEIIS